MLAGKVPACSDLPDFAINLKQQSSALNTWFVKMRFMDTKSGYKPVTILVFIFLIISVSIASFYWRGFLTYEHSIVFLNSLSIIVTLSVLFSAYLSLEATRLKSVSASELSSRPDIHWNIVSKSRFAYLEIESRKNQAFDFEAGISCNGISKKVIERHLEEYSSDNTRKYSVPLEDFFSKALGPASFGKISIDISFYSEVGGRYDYSYFKTVKKGKNAFTFSQRELKSVMLPWFENPKVFGKERA